jgi:prepilin-type N-terminal cleavage/methylation domain-containing protein
LRAVLADSEDGFTLIEILVAAFIMVLGALAVFLTFAAAIHSVQRGKDTQITQNIAQREMEKLRSLSYENVAFATGSLPAFSSTTTSPLYRVTASNYKLTKTGSESKPMATSAVGKLSATPTTFTSGGSSGKVYAFAVTMNDKPCEEVTKKVCTYKRVIIAVQLEKGPGQSYVPPYYELQSDFSNPAG